MQLRKFYGRTLSGAMGSVKRALGPEAIILETHKLEAGSPEARMNPGMLFEICAAGEGSAGDSPVHHAPAAATAKPVLTKPAMANSGGAGSSASNGKRVKSATANAAQSSYLNASASPLAVKLAAAGISLGSVMDAASREGSGPAAVVMPSLQARVAAAHAHMAPPASNSPQRDSPRDLARRRMSAYAGGPSAASNSTAGATPQAASVLHAPDRTPSRSNQTSPAVPPVQAAHAAPQGHRPSPLLDDLGLLKEQLRSLLADLEANPKENAALATDIAAGGVDIREYYAMIEIGVDHTILAPVFRRWLQWRTASAPVRKYIAQTEPHPAAFMRGAGFREWLWLEWLDRQGKSDAPSSNATSPRVQALVGPPGAGKTTSLAKLAARMRRERGDRVAVLNLDTHRFGAVEQWRKLGKLIGVHIGEIANEEHLRKAMSVWDRFDWIGIDTPGNLERHEPSRRLLQAIQEFSPDVETLLTLPATQHEGDSRARMRREEPWTSRKLLFTKLDCAGRPGTLINLTMDGAWGIDALTDGPRVPEDYRNATGPALWDAVLAAEGQSSRAGGLS